ncbi:hypothetical protein ACW5WY_18670 [Aeromonas aquatica]
MEMTLPCQQGKSRAEIVCLLCEQSVLKAAPFAKKTGRLGGGPLVSAGIGSAVESQSLAQHLIGDLTVLPGYLAVDQGHLNDGALEAVTLAGNSSYQRLKVSRLPST